MKRILHVVGHLGNGGDTTAIMNIMKYINDNNLDYCFDFLTHEGYNINYVNELKKEGTKVYVIEDDARVLGPYKYYQKINKILKNTAYDAIHFHTSFQSFVGL